MTQPEGSRIMLLQINTSEKNWRTKDKSMIQALYILRQVKSREVIVESSAIGKNHPEESLAGFKII